MSQPQLTPDFIVDEDSAPYPAGGDYTIEQLQAEGYPALLRIERGRVRNREIFGPMRWIMDSSNSMRGKPVNFWPGPAVTSLGLWATRWIRSSTQFACSS